MKTVDGEQQDGEKEKKTSMISQSTQTELPPAVSCEAEVIIDLKKEVAELRKNFQKNYNRYRAHKLVTNQEREKVKNLALKQETFARQQNVVIRELFAHRRPIFEVANNKNKDSYKWTIQNYGLYATENHKSVAVSSKALQLGVVDGGKNLDKDESENQHKYVFDMNLTFFPPSLSPFT